jgi:phospholipid-binding lipoprotein MlaA
MQPKGEGIGERSLETMRKTCMLWIPVLIALLSACIAAPALANTSSALSSEPNGERSEGQSLGYVLAMGLQDARAEAVDSGRFKGIGQSPVLISMADRDLDDTALYDDLVDEAAGESIADPLEPMNRFFFQFNDKLYFYFLKPVATGYKFVVPEKARIGVDNFFYNLAFPIRLFNCIFQGKFESAGDEFVRFVVNSTVGMGGLIDVATINVKLDKYDEDLGQTLGVYGMGPAFYLNLPVLGPSSLRDGIGSIGDAFMDPVNYIVPRTKYNLAVKGYERVNATSLTLGEYEDLKKSALDPYISVRDAYHQYRTKLIEE